MCHVRLFPTPDLKHGDRVGERRSKICAPGELDVASSTATVKIDWGALSTPVPKSLEARTTKAKLIVA